MKMSTLLKCRQCEDSESDKTVPRVEKCQRLNEKYNEERQSLDKYEGRAKAGANGYVCFSFNTFFPFF